MEEEEAQPGRKELEWRREGRREGGRGGREAGSAEDKTQCLLRRGKEGIFGCYG